MHLELGSWKFIIKTQYLKKNITRLVCGNVSWGFKIGCIFKRLMGKLCYQWVYPIWLNQVVKRVWSALDIYLACYLDRQTDIKGTVPQNNVFPKSGNIGYIDF